MTEHLDFSMISTNCVGGKTNMIIECEMLLKGAKQSGS